MEEPVANFIGPPRAPFRRPARAHPSRPSSARGPARRSRRSRCASRGLRSTASRRGRWRGRGPARRTCRIRAGPCSRRRVRAWPRPRPRTRRPLRLDGSTKTSRHCLAPFALALGLGRRGDRRRFGNGGDTERCAPELAHDDPHDPREEQVQDREEAELQERELGIGHRPLRLLVADLGFTDGDHVAVFEHLLVDRRRR